MIKRVMSWLLALCIVFGITGGAICVRAESPMAEDVPTAELTADTGYADYKKTVSGAEQPTEAVIALTEQGAPVTVGEGESVTLTVFVKEEGNYGIFVKYRSLSDAEALTDFEVDLSIDSGKTPDFRWLKGLNLERIWADAQPIVQDEHGDDVTPTQKESDRDNSRYLTDTYGQPLLYHFNAGKHDLTLTVRRGKIEFFSLALKNETKKPSYAEASADYSETNNGEYLQKIEAEAYSAKSSASIVPERDPSGAATTPNDPCLQKLNHISGTKFKNIGSWVEWEIEVPADGVYYFTFRSRQNYNSGMSSMRKLTVDGEVPFAECENLGFSYGGSWKMTDIGTGKEPYGFYLSAGKHTLRLTAVYGEMYRAVELAESIIVQMNELYNSVIMKIGNNPDKYRDYKLKSEIKDIDVSLSRIFGDVTLLKQVVVQSNDGKSGSAAATLQSILNMLSGFIKNPDKMAMSLDSYKNNTESLAAWTNNLSEQPIDFDALWVRSAGTDAPEGKVSVFKRIRFDIKRLISSFSSEYNIRRSDTQKNTVAVWANVGRDQLKVLKPMITGKFCTEYNAAVNLAINTDVSAAVLAGIGPDVCLFMDAGSPVNFAVRDVLLDLSAFPDFKEISVRFDEELLVPFMSVGGCAALPLTVSWPMMFVRNDVLKKLELTAPETWDDLYHAAAVLQRNHLEVGIPSHVGMFFTLLYQNGGAVFDENLETMFDNQAALTAFSIWSSYFAEYGFPLTYDFFNRFRSGEMPIGIADYTLYAQLKAAAPEIRGQWSMSELPGTVGENGQINRCYSVSSATGTVAGQGLSQGVTSAVIFSDAHNKDLAWSFLKWFTSADIQTEYGLGVEAQLGYTGRYASANNEALRQLPWNADEIRALEQARQNMVLIDEYPGNYYIAREVNNAFRSVVNNGTNPADILSRKNVLINKELVRKYEQFNIRRGDEK